MTRTAIFVGSFDPFTIGHDDIVRRALALVDHLVIGVGINEHKHYDRPAEERLRTIQQLYDDEPRITVKAFSDLGLCQASGAPCFAQVLPHQGLVQSGAACGMWPVLHDAKLSNWISLSDKSKVCITNLKLLKNTSF